MKKTIALFLLMCSFLTAFSVHADAACQPSLIHKHDNFCNKFPTNNVKITKSTYLRNEYSDYFQYAKVAYIQKGGSYVVLSGNAKTVEFSVSAGLKSPLNLISNSIGVTIKNTTIDLTGRSFKGNNNYIAPYYRKAWKVYQITEEVKVVCRQGTLMKSTNSQYVLNKYTKTGTVKVPFKDPKSDAKWMLFGKSSKQSGLPKTAPASSPIFK